MLQCIVIVFSMLVIPPSSVQIVTYYNTSNDYLEYQYKTRQDNERIRSTQVKRTFYYADKQQKGYYPQNLLLRM